MGFTNEQVARAAARGINAESSTGNMSTESYRTEFPRYGAPRGTGRLPSKLASILNDRFRVGAISQVIYSYATPIAWKDGDVWIIPDVTYSATTSSKHMPEVRRVLGFTALYIPSDCGTEEYLRVVEGLMEFGGEFGTRPGWKAGK